MAALADPEDKTALADLAPLPAAQRGESVAVIETSSGAPPCRIVVENAGESSGYLCVVRAEATYADLHPGSLYAIFTHPRNDGIFSGIKRVQSRRVLEEEPAPAPAEASAEAAAAEAAAAAQPPTSPLPPLQPATAIAYRKVEVEQVGEIHILMVRREFATRLVVEEDARGAARGLFQTRFSLLSSDALARFGGSWSIEPLVLREAQGGGGAAPEGCRVRLEQQVLPRGVPVFLQRVPVLGALLRRVSLAAVERLMRDLQAAVDALLQGDPDAALLGEEFAVHAALDRIKRDRRLAEQLARGGGGVASFAPGGEEEDEEDEYEDDEAGGSGAARGD